MTQPPLLRMQGIRKAFPGVQALDGVDFEVRAGEVMALVGENGAGKSTLIKILAGAHHADEGKIFINDAQVEISTPRQAQEKGVSVIYQELNLAEQISVAENILVGREIRNKLGLVNFKAQYAEAKKWIDLLQIEVDPDTEIRKLSIARKQMVEIAKALSLDASVIVMDEPTSSLPTVTTTATELNEVEILLGTVNQLRQRGKAIIYISHRMGEIFRISDRITVLRDGKLVGVKNTQETNPDEVVAMMVGRNLEDLYGKPTREKVNEVALEVRGISRENELKDISFNVRSGEILGVAGLVGAGRSEMARTVFGVDPKDTGTVLIDGKKANIRTPLDAIQAGIGYLPEDRKLQGLFLKMAIRLNMTAVITGQISQAGFIQFKKEEDIANAYVRQLNIRTPSIDQYAKNLSGGNQQKVVIAKWLAARPKILILDEPTRGVDVGAKMEIYNLMHTMAAQGMAVVMISSELPEILGMSDRIIVLREGELVGELNRAEATEEKIMAMATGIFLEAGR